MNLIKRVLKQDFRFVISAGPYLAYGIRGKMNFNSTFTSAAG